MSARALAEAALEVVRAGALASEHPAVGVEEQGDGTAEDLPFEDAQAVGAGLIFRDAIAAIRKAKGLNLGPQAKARLDRLVKGIDAQAAPKAKTCLASIKANKDGSWVDAFLDFRNDFEYADAASAAMAAFDELRAVQDPLASKAMGEARGAFQQGRRDEGYAKAKDVVDKYYASTSYRLAKKWLAERK